MEYLIANNGRYLGALSGTAEEVAAQIGEGNSTTMLPPPRSTDYWNGAEWVDIGSAPAWYFTYNYDVKAWQDTRDTSKAKRDKWEEIKLKRNTLEFGGFTHKGKKFDSDQMAQVRLLGAVVLGQPITWTLADTSTVDLTADEVKEVATSLVAHVNAAHTRGRIAKRLLDEATTNDQVDAVLF